MTRAFDAGLAGETGAPVLKCYSLWESVHKLGELWPEPTEQGRCSPGSFSLRVFNEQRGPASAAPIPGRPVTELVGIRTVGLRHESTPPRSRPRRTVVTRSDRTRKPTGGKREGPHSDRDAERTNTPTLASQGHRPPFRQGPKPPTPFTITLPKDRKG